MSLLLLFSGRIRPDASSSASQVGGSPLTWSHTVSGTDRLLIVGIHRGDNGNYIPSPLSDVTYDGVALTLLASRQGFVAPNGIIVELWYLIAPNTGTHNVVATGSGGGGVEHIVGGAQSWVGVDQSNPLGTSVTGAAAGGSASVVVSSAVGQVVQDVVVFVNGTGVTIGAGQTQEYQRSDGVPTGAASYEMGAASTTMSWTATSPVWAQVAVPILPVSYAGSALTRTLSEALGSIDAWSSFLSRTLTAEVVSLLDSRVLSQNRTLTDLEGMLESRIVEQPLAPDAGSEATHAQGVTSRTWSHTVSSAANRLLIVTISFSSTLSGPMSSVTYDGVAMTWLATTNDGDVGVEMWYLVAPNSGTHNIVVTKPTGDSVMNIAAGAQSWVGVSQSNPLGTYVGAAALGTSTASVTVSSAVGQYVQDSVGWRHSAPTVGGGQTEIWQGSPDGVWAGGSSYEAGATSVTMSWSIGTARNHAIMAVPILPYQATFLERNITDVLGIIYGLTRIGLPSAGSGWQVGDAQVGSTRQVGGTLAVVTAISDLLGLTDSRLGTLARTLTTDPLGILDSRTSLTVLSRLAADNLGSSDQVLQAYLAMRSIIDTVELLDAISAASVRSITDSLGLTDTHIQVLTVARLASDLLGLVDNSDAQLLLIARLIEDSLGLTDSAATDLARTLVELEGLTDSQTRTLAAIRTISEALGGLDDTSSFTGIVLLLGDSLGLLDGVQSVSTLVRVLMDQEGLTDAQAAVGVFSQVLSDNEGLLDSVTKVVTVVRSLADSLGITDQVSVISGLLAVLTDALGVSDSTTQALSRVLSDSEGLTDVLAGSSYSRAVNDLMGLSDATLRAADRLLSDNVGLLDSTVGLLARSLSELMGLTDASTAVAVLTRILTETEGLTDSRIQDLLLARALVDTLGLDDAVFRAAELIALVQILIQVNERRQAISALGRTQTITATDRSQTREADEAIGRRGPRGVGDP